MKKIFSIILLLAVCLTAHGQTNIVSNGNVFDVYQNGVYRSTHAKGSVYVDVDATGRYSIKRIATGAQVTTYMTMVVYQVNGTTYNNIVAFLNAIGLATMRTSCQLPRRLIFKDKV